MSNQITCPSCTTVFRVPANALADTGRKLRCSSCGHVWHAMPSELHAVEAVKTLDTVADIAPIVAQKPIEKQELVEEKATENNFFIDELLSHLPEEEEEDTQEEILSSGAARHAIDSIVQEEEDPFDYTDMAVFSTPMLAAPPKPFYANIYVLCAANMSACLLLVLMCAVWARVSVTAAIPATQSLYRMIGYENTDGLQLADIVFSSAKVGKNMRYMVRGQMVNQAGKPYGVPTIRARLFDKKGILQEEWILGNKAADGQPRAMLAAGEQKAFNLRLPVKNDKVVLLALDIGSPLEIDLRK